MSNQPLNFRWMNSNQNASEPPITTSQQSRNPFSTFYSSLSDYIPVNSSERPNEEEAFYALSRWERFLGFLLCCAGAAVCFFIAFFTIPLLALKPAKFAVAFSMGNILFMMAFTVLQGPKAQFLHLTSKERLPFTMIYFISLGLTLFFALGRKSYLPTLLCAIIQVIALVSYLVAYFPGGGATLLMGGRIALRGASSLLPI